MGGEFSLSETVVPDHFWVEAPWQTFQKFPPHFLGNINCNFFVWYVCIDANQHFYGSYKLTWGSFVYTNIQIYHWKYGLSSRNHILTMRRCSIYVHEWADGVKRTIVTMHTSCRLRCQTLSGTGGWEKIERVAIPPPCAAAWPIIVMNSVQCVLAGTCLSKRERDRVSLVKR